MSLYLLMDLKIYILLFDLHNKEILIIFVIFFLFIDYKIIIIRLIFLFFIFFKFTYINIFICMFFPKYVLFYTKIKSYNKKICLILFLFIEQFILTESISNKT